MNDKLLQTHEVMALFGIRSRTTLSAWVEKGEIPRPVRIGKRQVRWRESDIQSRLADLPYKRILER